MSARWKLLVSVVALLSLAAIACSSEESAVVADILEEDDSQAADLPVDDGEDDGATEPVDEPEEEPGDEEAADPERRYLSREISAAVRGCLERLASPRRSAVTLHLLAYKVPRIAERMGWKRKQAENLVYRGMEDLRRCLRNRGVEP